MRLSLLISLSLLLAGARNLNAQLLPAEDFFNGGAQFYISNNIPAALERVESGLKVYPDDEKLKKLEQLLKQQQKQNQQQQQQNQQQQKQQQQSKSDQQKNQQNKQNQQNQSQSQKDQQKQDEQNKSEQQKQQAQQKQQEQQSAADKQKAEEEKKQQGKGQPVKPGQMTPEEAKHLLDAQKGDEQILQMKPKEKPEQSQQPVKDW